MSYIVVAEFDSDTEMNRPGAKEVLLRDPLIRLLSERDGRVCLDMPGDYFRKAEITMYLCQKLIEAGVYQFDIRHSC